MNGHKLTAVMTNCGEYAEMVEQCKTMDLGRPAEFYSNTQLLETMDALKAGSGINSESQLTFGQITSTSINFLMCLKRKRMA